MERDAEGRERVVPNDCPPIALSGENKWRGDHAPRILCGLFLEILVKRFVAAREIATVVVFSYRLDDEVTFTGHWCRAVDVLYSAARLFVGAWMVQAQSIALTQTLYDPGH